MFYFLRHGESDDINRNKKIYQGFGVNLLPLSKAGVEQIKAACKDKRLQRADIILSSHYKKVIVAAHGMMIETVTGCHHPYHAEIIEFEL